MKYYIVSEISWNYDGADDVSQTIYSANSPEELFKYIHNGRGYDYQITEDDIIHPDPKKYKTPRAYNQAMRAFRESLSKKIADRQCKFNAIVIDFKEYTKELNIPCHEDEMRRIQNFNLFTCGY